MKKEGRIQRYKMNQRNKQDEKCPGGGDIFCARPDRPWGSFNLLYNG
jgi:hypothetical protein